MSALADFYKKAMADPSIMADLKAAKEKAGGAPSGETICSAISGIAKKHGITLSQADFRVQNGSLEDEELKAVSGGCWSPDNCNGRAVYHCGSVTYDDNDCLIGTNYGM